MIPSAHSEDGWHGMDSAPKDGTKVTLWVVQVPTQYTRAADMPGGWEGPCQGRWNAVLGNWDGDGMLAGEPVRWRPRPSRPTDLPPALPGSLED